MMYALESFLCGRRSSCVFSEERSCTLEARRKKERGKRMLVRLLLVMLVVLCCGLGMYAVAWYISQRLLNSSFAGWPSSIHILGVTEDTVTIERTSESVRPGVYGIDWPGGYALLGEIVEASATS